MENPGEKLPRLEPEPVAPEIRHVLNLLERAGADCEVVLADGRTVRCGDAPPSFTVRLRSDDVFRSGLGERAIGEAYLDGQLDFEGDLLRLMDLRSQLADALDWRMALRLGWRSLMHPVTRVNREAIAGHYNLGDDFYLTFLDTVGRFYSQCHFTDESLTLEAAAERKLEAIGDVLQLRPGMRLLDIGGGWGGVEEYFGQRGVEVTTLTIAEDSHAFIRHLIAEQGLAVQVRLEDFLDHQPERPYDAAVMLGVIEHVPHYQRFAERIWACLAPGGRLYLDASATIRKYDIGAFARRYIWPGPHTFLCLQDLVGELLYHGLDVLEVRNESRDYELTMRHWAERFDAQRPRIVERWGERTYRAFRLYLWAGARELGANGLQAYRVVARRRPDPGPRPGRVRRMVQFLRDLF
jgi:cyclopropane-fatty-acyl-phospholipid synthase